MGKLIITIDPGSNGAICTYRIKQITSVNMPENLLPDLKDYLLSLIEIEPDCICFIEKLQMMPMDLKVGGKVFGIQKMLANYERLKTLIQMLDIPLYEIHPKEWQKPFLGNKKFKEKNHRKAYLKVIAKRKIKTVKVTLKNCDALLMLIYANDELKRNPKKYVKPINKLL